MALPRCRWSVWNRARHHRLTNFQGSLRRMAGKRIVCYCLAWMATCLVILRLFVQTFPRLSWVFVELSSAARHQSCSVLLHNMPASPSSTSTSPKQSSSHSSSDALDQQNSRLKRRFVELEQASPMPSNAQIPPIFTFFLHRNLEGTIA